MNRDDILKMEAGREIDALVAEKVMGWKPWLEQRGEYTYIIWQKPNDREPWFRSRDWKSLQKNYEPFEGKYDPHKHIEILNFKPSTDISAAWELIKEMSAKGYWCYMGTLSSESYAVFTKESLVPLEKGRASVYDLPLAICRAALLAVME